MKKFLSLLVAICLMTGMSSVAKAVDLDIYLFIIWEAPLTHYDCYASITLLDDGVPIEGRIDIPLDPDTYFEEWSVTLLGVPLNATSVRFEWLAEDQEAIDWDANGFISEGPPAPVVAEWNLNWFGDTVIDAWADVP